jgi:hypothetical protein
MFSRVFLCDPACAHAHTHRSSVTNEYHANRLLHTRKQHAHAQTHDRIGSHQSVPAGAHSLLHTRKQHAHAPAYPWLQLRQCARTHALRKTSYTTATRSLARTSLIDDRKQHAHAQTHDRIGSHQSAPAGAHSLLHTRKQHAHAPAYPWLQLRQCAHTHALRSLMTASNMPTRKPMTGSVATKMCMRAYTLLCYISSIAQL